MAIITNREILALAKDDPTFKSWTSKITDKIFTDAGYEDFAKLDKQFLSDFFNISVRVYLQKIKTAQPHIPSVYKAIVEEYDNPNGGIMQRINTHLIKPTSPKYRNLVNGGSVDPFVVRKPQTTERFFKQNFDYQNQLSIQDIDLKKMFMEEGGLSDYIKGLMSSLDDSYAIQKFETMREMISLMISSTTHPLQNSQKVEVGDITDSSSNADMAKFIQVFHNMYDLMKNSAYSGKFNAKKFEHGMNPDDYVLLLRADIWNNIKTTLMATSFHTENLGIPFQVETVKDFGGITYKQVSSGEALKPVYDDFGAVKGFNKTGSGAVIDEDDIAPVDPHEKVSALLVQKGAIFTTVQQPYETRAIYNPAGMYTNFFANQPNGSFNYDSCYDVVEYYHA